jgi:uncharacterized membrane protein YbhN (UPF0104 family)
MLAGLFALYLLSTVAWAARWRRLLMLANLRPTLGWVWRVTMQAQAAGILLPGGLGGDALRGSSAVAAGATLPVAVGSLLLDRAIGLATLAALGAVAGVTMAGASNVAAISVLACVPVAFVVGVFTLRSRLVRTSKWLDRPVLARSVKPVVEYLADDGAPRAVRGCVLLSFAVSAIQFGVNRGLIAAIGVTPASETAVYVGLTLAFTSAVIPSLPGGWGTVDAAYIYCLGLAGLSSSSALVVCMLFRLFWYLSGALGAILLVVRPAPALVPAGSSVLPDPSVNVLKAGP